MSIKKLFIVPVIFSVMAIETLLSSFKLDLFSIGVWSGAILVGAISA